MKFVQTLKELNVDNHHHLFTKLFRSVERRISMNPRWLSGGTAERSDISGIVFNIDRRLMMQPGEVAGTTIVSNPHRNPKQGSLNQPVLLIGTPYGLCCLHYPFEASGKPGKALFGGISFSRIHAPDNLLAATARFMERKSDLVKHLCQTAGSARESSAICTPGGFLKFWMLTENFQKDLAEQAELDQALGLPVCDGIPLPEVPPRTEKKVIKARTESNKPSHTKDNGVRRPTNHGKPSGYREMTRHATQAQRPAKKHITQLEKAHDQVQNGDLEVTEVVATA